MKQSGKIALGVLGALASIATIVGTLAVLDTEKARRDFGEAFFPVGLIIVLALAVIWLLIALVLTKRRQSRGFSPVDQDLLDRILGLLPRPLMRDWRGFDFSCPWPTELILPVEAFLREFGDVEHEFGDAKLEAARKRLSGAASRFASAVAQAASSCRSPDGHLRLEWSQVNRDRPDMYWPRREKLLKTRRDFNAAHDKFLTTAKKRGFDISAVAGTSGRDWQEPVSFVVE